MLFPTNRISDADTADQQGSSPVTHLLTHLLLHKRLISGAAVAGLLISALALCFMTPRYSAEAVVIVDSRRDKLADAQSAVSGIVVDQYQTALKSEIAMITSPALARRVMGSLGLLQTQEYQSALTHTPTAEYFTIARGVMVDQVDRLLVWAGLVKASPITVATPVSIDSSDAALEYAATKIFAKRLEAVNEPKSLTLRISYQSTVPETAAAVANAVADGYLADDIDMKQTASARSAQWLLNRIAQLRMNLESAEHAVEDFRAKHDLATIRDRAPLEEEMLALKGRRLDAQGQVSAAQAKVVQTSDPSKPDALVANNDVLNSRMIAGLLQLEAQLRGQQAGMSASHQIDSRSMASINDQIRAVHTELTSEIGHYAQSSVLELHMAELRLTDINSQIAALQLKINASNIADIKLRSLEQDASAARSVLDDLTKRYNQDAGAPLAEPDSRIVSRAAVPVDPTSPHYGLVLAGGMLGFATLAFGSSVVATRMRRGYSSIQQLGEEIGFVVAGLTTILTSRRLRSAAKDTPPMREIAVTIRALAHTPLSNPTRVVLVTSTVPGEGKSTVALALARSVANAGQRCLLIDADVRKPSLHTSLHVPATPGLVDLALDPTTISAIRTIADERFDLLPVGRPTVDMLSLFTDNRLNGMLTMLKEKYDVIILDSAPVLLASEGLVISGYADVTLFLVKWRTTPREIVRKAAAMLTRCSSGTCLSVLTQMSSHHLRRGGAGVEDQYRSAYYLS